MTWLLAAVILFGCSGKIPLPDAGPKTCDDVSRFFHETLDLYQNEMDGAGREYQIEQWRQETADPSASAEKLSQSFSELQKMTYNSQILSATEGLAKSTEGLSCPMREKLLRVKGLLESSILTKEEVIRLEKENQERQDKLATQSNGFRMSVAGEKEPISRALYGKKLAAMPDRKAREVLYREFNPGRANKWLEWGFRELLKSRNAEAKAAGFPTYYEYRFFRSQLDLKNYLSMAKDVKAKLAPKVRVEVARLGRTHQIKKVEDWDLRFLREEAVSGSINELLKTLPEKTVLDVARDFWKALGIDIDSYAFMMDLFPRPGKNTHAFAMAVVFPHVNNDKVKADIRFLANLRQPVTWEDIATVIHELGHAIHAAEVKQPLGIFRGFGSVDTEAIAMTAERMASSQEFYEAALPKYAQADVKKLRPLLRKQMRAERVEQAFVLLRQVFFSDFEYEMYKNPDADFALLWSKMHEEYWGVPVEPKIAGWDIADHFISSPVYIENYAIGILMVEQLYEGILRDFKTSYNSVKLGDKLRSQYFAPGQEFSYLDLVQHFSGQPLSAAAALKLLD